MTQARTPEQREAQREYNRQYRLKNRERLLEYDRQRNAARYAAMTPEQRAADLARQRAAHAADPSKRRAINARAIAKRREQRLQAWREWYAANRAHAIAKASARRAHILQATPAWADLGQIRGIYEMADYMQRLDGVERHVDHSIPLRGKQVSGLHVQSNLRVITAEANLRKGNQHGSR